MTICVIIVECSSAPVLRITVLYFQNSDPNQICSFCISGGKVTRLENYAGGQERAKAENKTFSLLLQGKNWLKFVTGEIYNFGK